MDNVEKFKITAPISKHDKETAIRVLMRSKIVRHWVESQAKFFMLEPRTPEWHEFYMRMARDAAKKLIS